MPATSAAKVEAFGFIATGNLGDESMWEPDSEGIFRMANRPCWLPAVCVPAFLVGLNDLPNGTAFGHGLS